MLALHSLYSSIPGWLMAGAVIVAAWQIARGSGGQALGIERQSNEVLRGKLAELTAENAELRRTHTLEPLLDEARKHDERMAELLAASEAAAEQREGRARLRDEGLLLVLERMAERLGPDPNGGHREAA